MNERTLRLATMVLSVVGAAISAYLVYVHESGGAPICASGGCETVQHSSYAEMFGVPVAALGLVGFVGLLVAAIARGEGARLTQATLALSAFLFGAYLFFVQIAVIGAVCQWCVATDVLMTAITALALLRLRVGAVRVPAAVPATPVPPYPKRRPKGQPREAPAEAAGAHSLSQSRATYTRAEHLVARAFGVACRDGAVRRRIAVALRSSSRRRRSTGTDQRRYTSRRSAIRATMTVRAAASTA